MGHRLHINFRQEWNLALDKGVLDRTFSQARLKVNRANRHIYEAQRVTQDYVLGDFYNLSADINIDSGRQQITARTIPVPYDLALSIGDAFHCLSGALDYCISGIILAKTGNSTRITFPSDETRKGLRKSFMSPKVGAKSPPNRRVMKAFPLIALEILAAIKSYRGGGNLVWEVRKADNIDKHNLIIPTVAISTVTGVCLADDVNNVFFDNISLKFVAGRAFSPISYGGSGGSTLKIQNQGEATIEVVFPRDMEVFAGDAVFPTLTQCSQLVWEVITRIENITLRYV